jgi:hypothetical protein
MLGSVIVMAMLSLFAVACGDSGADGAGDGVLDNDPTAQGSSGADGSRADLDGCGLVSEEEVAESVGLDVSGATSLPAGCQWIVAAADTGGSFDWQAIPLEAFEANRVVAGFQIDELDGLGDEAYRRGPEGGGDAVSSEVWVRTGDGALFVRSSGLPNSDEVLAGQEALAEVLVARLG